MAFSPETKGGVILLANQGEKVDLEEFVIAAYSIGEEL